MLKKASLLLAIISLCIAPIPAPLIQAADQGAEISIYHWSPTAGDIFVVDVSTNSGFLIHQNGQYTEFPVITGQRRTVNYIGRTYFAGTPTRNWTAQSLENKGPSYTFGSGDFLRLNWDNEKTAYGIHGHRDWEVMFNKDFRYQSMGCIIVTPQYLEIIKQTFRNNGDTLAVYTHYSTDDVQNFLNKYKPVNTVNWLGYKVK